MHVGETVSRGSNGGTGPRRAGGTAEGLDGFEIFLRWRRYTVGLFPFVGILIKFCYLR